MPASNSQRPAAEPGRYANPYCVSLVSLLKRLWGVAMKAMLVSLWLLACTFGTTAETQTNQGEEALRALPKAFAAAWVKRDAHELAKIVAEDIDFVTVGAVWLQGRADFAKYHAWLLEGRANESTLTPLETSVRFIRPDLAVVHWSWGIKGDRNLDGSARSPRFGLMTMVAEMRAGTWLVVAAQNTNGTDADVAPTLRELGITRPIAVPRAASAP